MAATLRVEMIDGIEFEYAVDDADKAHKAARNIITDGWDNDLGDQSEYYPASRIRRVKVNPPPA